MTARKIVGAGLILAVLAGSLGAQVMGKHRGLFVSGANIAAGTGWALQVDASGKTTTFRTQVGKPGAPWPIWGNTYGMTMSADNRTVIVPGIASPSLNPLVYALVRYDPQAKAVVGTLWKGVSTSLNLGNWSNLTLNSDGDVITIDNATQPDSVAEYDVFAGRWRRTPLPELPQWPGLGIGAGVAGCEWDEFQGGFHHASWYGSIVVPGYLFHTSWDYRVTTTLVPVPKPSFAGNVLRFGGTLLENGDWASSLWFMSSMSYSHYHLVPRGGSGWTWVQAGTGTTPWDVTHEKYAAPGRGIWVANWIPAGARHIDVQTNTVTVIHAGGPTTWPTNAYEILPLYDRDLGSERTGKATWNLYINPGAGSFAGHPYAIAASLTLRTKRPGIRLPDGREIFIGTDALTAITATGPLPPFLTGNHGTLDTKGFGLAKIDLTKLGRGANGTVLHFCGLVLDPRAPSGIGWVTDPHAFVIDVMP